MSQPMKLVTIGSPAKGGPPPAQSMSLRPNLTDADSRNTFDFAMCAHKSARVLRSVLDYQGHVAQDGQRGRMVQLKDGLRYEDILQQQLGADEHVLLAGEGVDFNSFTLETPGYPPVFHPAGRVILTNKRLVIMSASESSLLMLRKEGNPKRNMGQYKVEYALQDSVAFASYKLHWCKTVAMSAAAGVKQSIAVRPDQNNCCGITCCFAKRWRAAQTEAVENRHREVVFGVQVPIQGPKVLKFQVSFHETLSKVNAFVAEFQRASPDLNLD